MAKKTEPTSNAESMTYERVRLPAKNTPSEIVTAERTVEPVEEPGTGKK